MANDYRTIQWFKITALTGGTSYIENGLGLCPWYLQCFNDFPALTNVAPVPVTTQPDGALPPVAEPPAG